MVEVVVTEEFTAWYTGLDEADQVQVGAHVDVLEEHGVSLGTPRTSAIIGSTVALRELRIQSSGRPFRVFYVFDPKRQAVLLIGGDKTGRDHFYQEMIPLAERIYAAYLREIAP